MKQCNRRDDDGTEYAILFEDLQVQPYRLIQRIVLTQSTIISPGRIHTRIRRILPVAARWLEIWELKHKQEPKHWRAHPTYEIRSGLRQAIITVTY